MKKERMAAFRSYVSVQKRSTKGSPSLRATGATICYDVVSSSSKLASTFPCRLTAMITANSCAQNPTASSLADRNIEGIKLGHRYCKEVVMRSRRPAWPARCVTRATTQKTS